MDNILTCTFMGSHLDANKSFQNNFLNCVLKLLFRDTVVTLYLGFLKSTKWHRQQKFTRVRGERDKRKANPVLWSIETIRKKALHQQRWSQSSGCPGHWLWYSLGAMDHFSSYSCLSSTVLLTCLPAFVTDTAAARAGA